MKTVGNKVEAFKVVGVKPGFNLPEEKGVSAFEAITEQSFPGKWKVIYFYPKDFTFVCPTEIAAFGKLWAGGASTRTSIGSTTGNLATLPARWSISWAFATSRKAWR